jgi:phospholipid N-methyltransferase
MPLSMLAIGPFWREFRRDFFHTGAIAPSSRFLARAMADAWPRHADPVRVLEVGPGTGAFTGVLVERLRPQDRLDLVEINPRFVAHLRQRLAEEPRLRAKAEQVTVIEAPVQTLTGERRYHHAVSGLPLNNFPVELVRTILTTLERLLVPGGTLTFFEYLAIRRLKSPFVGPAERARLGEIGRILGDYQKRHEFRQDWIMLNLPPAVAHHWRFDGSSQVANEAGQKPT